jgi:quinolinate synthase
MKTITLRKIRRALETMQHAIEIDPAVAISARRAVERMLAVN